MTTVGLQLTMISVSSSLPADYFLSKGLVRNSEYTEKLLENQQIFIFENTESDKVWHFGGKFALKMNINQ